MRRVLLLAALSVWAVACAEASAAPPEPGARVRIFVAARDLPAGTVLKREDVEERSVPEAMVTRSLLNPASVAYLVDQRLVLPMLAGDPVQVPFFESLHVEAYQACAKLEREDVSAAQQVARARHLVISSGQ